MKRALTLLALCFLASGCMPKFRNAEFTYPGSGPSWQSNASKMNNSYDRYHQNPDAYRHRGDRY